ncbi:MAG: hypothetical protein IPM56_07600 [Ignavibacteriales bacterium]|nr:MAG: hypothetical protein IPM56_07600 [Ignavibacteriales bacterium]
MNWYSIRFTHNQVRHGKDRSFIQEFKVLCDQLKKPDGLSLFKDNHRLNHYQFYFLRTPENFPFDAEKLFAHNAEVYRTFPPAVMMLEPIEGDY